MKKNVVKIISKAQSELAKGDKADPDILNELLDEINKEQGDEKKWWVIVLKVIVYAIGLILAGYGTTAAAMTLTRMM